MSIVYLNSVCPKFQTYAGLRLFREAKYGDSRGKVWCYLNSMLLVMVWAVISEICLYPQYWDDNPGIMAVGVVDATPEAIFRILMSLGPSRSE